MSIIDILMKMPWWYVLIIIVFSLYYAIRGIMDLKIRESGNTLSKTEKWVIHYIQEFLFKVIVTMSSFVALSTANYIFSSLKSVNDIGAGTAVLLIFLIIWGICGISGYLTFLIVSRRFPAMK
ncbi:MAG: hypothetical protein KAV18_03770 [Candidatus Omnitrophica bacterium]|nr:hypothetical protein [Candidatus Omnitrophota bacterium]